MYNVPTAWHILGFIPDLEAKSSVVKAKASQTLVGKGILCHNYHKCLDIVLESFKRAQTPKKEGLFVCLGDEVYLILPQLPLAFVIGDAKSGDMLCGHFGRYKCTRMSRSCLVPIDECDNPNHQCKLIKASDIEEISHLASEEFEEDMTIPIPKTGKKKHPVNHNGLTMKELDNQRSKYMKLLHELSQHRHHSAFIGVNFGANSLGIHGAMPTDLMHAFLVGFVKYIMHLVIDPMKPSDKVQLDFWIDHVFGKLKNSE